MMAAETEQTCAEGLIMVLSHSWQEKSTTKYSEHWNASLESNARDKARRAGDV